MRDNPVVEIADLNIKAPVLEGTDNKILSKEAGNFIGTGDFGIGKYCIAVRFTKNISINSKISKSE